MNASTEKTQHTPGPWGYDSELGVIYYDDGDLQPGIAEISQDNTSDEQANADGKLIAAAPALLDLAQTFRRTVLFYIGVDEKKGDDEGASLKRNTLMLIDEILSRAVPA